MKFLTIFVVLFFKISSYAALPEEFKNFPWKTGDIIGVSELFYDWSTFFFEAATGSRYGHVGIISVEPGGVFVYEENDPEAQKTDIDIFLSRAVKNPVTKKTLASIIRPKVPLTEVEIHKILWAANEAVFRKIPYNSSQMMNSKSLNCSEFIRAVYAQAGRDVGRIEKLGSMNLKSFNGLLLKAWEYTSAKINPDSLVISPMSVMTSEDFYPVFANLPLTYYLSDRQIYSMWKEEGFITELSKQTYIPEFILNYVGSRSSTIPWRKF